MNLSQPAISQMLKDLEEEFGTALVDRSVRGVALNEKGRLALQRTRPGLAFLDQLARELVSQPRPHIRVGANPTIMLHLVPLAMQRLHSAGMPATFSFRTGLVTDMITALTSGEIDCYVGLTDWTRITPEQADMLICRPLSQTPAKIACAANHPLAGQGPVKPAALLDYPWISGSQVSSSWNAVQLQFRRAGLKPPQPEIEAELLGMLGITAVTDCLICAPLSAIQHPFSRSKLVPLEVEGFFLQAAPTEFVSLVAPDPGTPLHLFWEALEGVANSEGLVP